MEEDPPRTHGVRRTPAAQDHPCGSSRDRSHRPGRFSSWSLCYWENAVDRVIRFGLRCALIALVAAGTWFLPTSQRAAADINPALQASTEANIALRHVLEARHHLVAEIGRAH